MLRAGAALSIDPDPARAAVEAAELALAQAGASRADAALVFTTGHRDGGRLAAAAAERLGGAVAGAPAHGVLAGDREEEERPAVAVLALCGVIAEAFGLAELAGVEDAAGLEIEARLGRSATEADLVVVLADPLALDAPRLLRGLADGLGPAQLVGAGAAPGPSGAATPWCGRSAVPRGASGLVLELPRPARLALTQGCRPITEVMVATRIEGRWILEIDDRPALDVYCEAAGGPLAADLRRASERLLVALPRSRPARGRRAAEAGFVVRQVAGFAPERRAFAVAEELRAGAPLRFALRDAELAREDLKRAFDASGADPGTAGLYLSCSGRGRGLFGHAGLEVAYVAQAVAPAALAGMFGAFQLGPVAGTPELLTVAGVLALLG